MGVASIDLCKALDSGSHALLLQKLENRGLSGRCLKWLQSYLTQRTQQVRFNEHTSEKIEVLSGVPQGSVLGPILFIAFTSDLVDHLGDECIVKAYADDTQLLVGGKNQQEVKEKLEKAINRAQQWFSNNSLLINPTKTEIMMLGKKSKEGITTTIDVKEGDTTVPLRLETQIKILGVTIDDQLTWKPHVKQVKKRATNVIRNLARASEFLPPQSRRILYDSLVAPHFSYADVVWDGCLKEQQQDLQRAHNFAARVICRTSKYSSATAALEKLGMVPLVEKRKMHQVVMAHKLINGKGPHGLRRKFGKVKPTTSVNQEGNVSSRLRSRSRMHIPPTQHSSARFERSTVHRMSKAWNSVSIDNRKIEDQSKFKAAIQRELTCAYWGRSINLSRPW